VEGNPLNNNTTDPHSFDVEQLYRVYQSERLLEMPSNFVGNLFARYEAEQQPIEYQSMDALSEERSIEKIMRQVQTQVQIREQATNTVAGANSSPSLFEICSNFFEQLSWAVKAPVAVALSALLALPMVNIWNDQTPGAELAYEPAPDTLLNIEQVSSQLELGGNTLLSHSGSPSDLKRALTLGALSVDLSVSNQIDASDKRDVFLQAIRNQTQSLGNSDLVSTIDQSIDAAQSGQDIDLRNIFGLLGSEFSEPQASLFYTSGQLIETLRLESALGLEMGKGESLSTLLGDPTARELLEKLAFQSDAYPVHVSRLLQIDLGADIDRRTLKQINRSANSLLMGE
jgi:hypothetical protein